MCFGELVLLYHQGEFGKSSCWILLSNGWYIFGEGYMKRIYRTHPITFHYECNNRRYINGDPIVRRDPNPFPYMDFLAILSAALPILSICGPLLLIFIITLLL